MTFQLPLYDSEEIVWIMGSGFKITFDEIFHKQTIVCLKDEDDPEDVELIYSILYAKSSNKLNATIVDETTVEKFDFRAVFDLL